MMLTTLQFMFFCFRVLLICSLFFSKPTCNSAHTGRALLPRSFFFLSLASMQCIIFHCYSKGPFQFLHVSKEVPELVLIPTRGNEGILSYSITSEDLFHVSEGRSGKLTSNIPFSCDILWFLDSKTYWRNELWSTSLSICPPIKWSWQGPRVISNFL